MTPRTKTLFAILFGVPLLLAMTCAAVVFAVSRSGSLEVSIQEKHGGGNVHVRLPALLVPVTLAVAVALKDRFSFKTGAMDEEARRHMFKHLAA